MLDILEARSTEPIGGRDYIFRHDRYGEIVLAAGGRRVIPLAVALVSLGNPGAVNTGKDKLRDVERGHVFMYNGFYPGMHSQSAWFDVGMDLISGEPLGPLCPPVEIYNLDTGERIFMVHDDPTGEHATGTIQANVADALDPNQAFRQLEQLNRARLEKAQSAIDHGLNPAELAAAAADPLDAALDQAQRNAIRDEIPAPPPDAPPPVKDRPRAPRSGAK